ncbi:hypothetical protein [Cronobacter sakazakii]|uniref:hypothetical protein n=1 Tax=Cronobacter sakazakii TaxID=28141 RepID=UPI000A18E9D2|nr:hypothetical protein [Cronobacter sakazakii]PQY53936.1 hypothetical protein C5945_01580 [Cronobacter sakazakii]PUZ03117.1 hypothetical protein B8W55_01580 [Cronobacter sakazakii]TYD51206.1 hypothetical protein FNN14_06090 [Cronobacter sakazakii]
MSTNQKIEKLKRISFVSGEDFYFLTYLIIICIKEFSTKKMIFKDHRKLTYLMQLVSNSIAVNILIENYNKNTLKPFDKEFLFDVYVRASLHQREVYKIIRSLEKNGFITLINTDKVDCYNLEVINKDKLNDFFNTDIFDTELNNATMLKTHFKSINTLGLEGLIDKFFTNYGLNLWAN